MAVLKKNKKDATILFIDATKEFVKITNSNKLSDKNINNILKIFTERKEIKHLAHLATYEEIKEKDFNLSVSTYVEKEDKREIIDIKKLNLQIDEIVKKEDELRTKINKIIKEIEK